MYDMEHTAASSSTYYATRRNAVVWLYPRSFFFFDTGTVNTAACASCFLDYMCMPVFPDRRGWFVVVGRVSIRGSLLWVSIRGRIFGVPIRGRRF